MQEYQRLPKSVYTVFDFCNILSIDIACVVKPYRYLIDIVGNVACKFMNFTKLVLVNVNDVALEGGLLDLPISARRCEVLARLVVLLTVEGDLIVL